MITKIDYKDQDEFEIKLLELGWIQRGMSGILWQDPNDPYESCFTVPIAKERVIRSVYGVDYNYTSADDAFNDAYNAITINGESDIVNWLHRFTTSGYYRNQAGIKIISNKLTAAWSELNQGVPNGN